MIICRGKARSTSRQDEVEAKVKIEDQVKKLNPIF